MRPPRNSRVGLLATPFAALLIALSTGCSRSDGPERPNESTQPTADTPSPVTGRHTFVIVSERSKASYRAREEFFAGAFRRIGIEAGKVEAIGSTRAIEGKFQLDPERLDEPVGDNAFSVRLTTLTSNQTRRDDYIREIRDDGGPSFDQYPLATFTATGITGTSKANASGRELTLKLAGNLTVRLVTKPVVFDVKAQLTGATLAGTATTGILLSAFGIGPIDFYDTLTVADDVGIEVEFTARAE
jgi:polyisoprenoid-binding protein YceI